LSNRFVLFFEKVYKKIAEDANRTEMRWFSNQAAVLAEKLEQDMPCAVCGSLKHPNPAVFSENELVL
jgi:exonuclease SbcC